MTERWDMGPQPSQASLAICLPPATVDEAAWDILLALHADRDNCLGLEPLARLASLPQRAFRLRLALLEERQLITGATDAATGEIRAVLTPAGRALLDRYLSATTDLQVGSVH